MFPGVIDSIINLNLIYRYKIIRDLKITTSIIIVLINKIEYLITITLPKNPKNGGKPPKDIKIKTNINLFKAPVEIICLNIIFSDPEKISSNPIKSHM